MLTIAVAVLTVKLALALAFALHYRRRWLVALDVSAALQMVAVPGLEKQLTETRAGYEDRLAIAIQHTADARADRDAAQMKLDAIARLQRRIPRRKWLAAARRIARAVA